MMTSLQRNITSLGAALLLSGVTQLSAGSMLLDRGLPTANLNNIAGVDRSNVSWLFTQYTPASYWLVGDSITNTSAETWYVDTIRLWSMAATESAQLWGGLAGSSIEVVANSGAITSAAYFDNSLYQVQSGAYRAMHQIDFAVNLSLAPGQVYNFFFDGRSSDSGQTLAFVHASNADLSGSSQEGADNTMLYANVLSDAINSTDVGPWTSLGNGWDKPSDVNVQVFGTVPDVTATLGLLGLALLALVAMRRKQS